MSTRIAAAVRRFFCLCACALLVLPLLATPLPGTGFSAARWVSPTLNPNSLAVTPDGAYVAAPLGFGLIGIYRLADGVCARTLAGHGALVRGIAISADGQMLASGDTDGEVRVWRMSDGACLRVFAKTASVNGVAFSPDGSLLVTSHTDKLARLWQVSDGTLLRTFTGHTSGLTKVAFSPDGLLVATASADRNVKVWQVSDGTCVFTLSGHTSTVYAVAFSPDGTLLASGGLDNTVRLWQISDGAPVRTINLSGVSANSLAFSPDGVQLACGDGYGSVRLYQVSNGSTIRTLNGQAGTLDALAYTSDGQQIVSGANDKSVRVWQVSNGAVLRTITATGEPAAQVAVSPDGQMVATACTNGSVTLRSAGDGTLIRMIPAHPGYNATGVAFSPDGLTLATSSYDKTAKLWQVSDGTLLRTFTGHTKALSCVAFTPDGQTLITAGYDNTAICWQVSDGTILHTLSGHTDGIYDIAVSADGQVLATGSGDKTIRLWQLSDGAFLRTLSGHTAAVTTLVFTADGQTLISSGSFDGKIKCWQVSDGTCLRTLTNTSSQVDALALSPDGATLAVGNYDNNITYWRTSDFTPLWTQHGLGFCVNAVKFLPNGQTLAMAGWDGVAVWRVTDSQPDLQIRPLADAGYTGAGIYNLAGQQTVAAATNSTAAYAIKLVNDGPADMNYFLQGGAGDTGWTVRYFDALAGGNDITQPVTSASGWAVRLASGEACELRAEVQPDAALPAQSNSTLQISANSMLLSDTVYATTTVIHALTNVALAATPPAPQLANTSITLTATPIGGGTVEYKFRAGYQDAAGWHWSDLTNYQTTASCTWTPTTTRLYTLLVYAREQGSAKAYDVLGSLSYRIATSLSAVSIGVTPHTPQVLGTPITLTASPTGGALLVYLFKAGYQDAAGWHWSVIREYDPSASFTWTATVPHLYTVLVYVREQGSTAAYQKYASLDYRISAPPITDATLAAEPSAPQPVNTPITLTAGATGGYAVEYKFKAGYQDATGWHWTELTCYQTTPTCTWTPADAHTYTLVLYAREVGSTLGYQRYATLGYRITPLWK